MTLSSGVRKKCVRFLITILFCQMTLTLWEQSLCQAEPGNLNIRPKHVSSYQKMENAIKDVDELKSKGHEAYFKEVEIPEKGTWYRVFTVEPQPQSPSPNQDKDKKRAQANVKTATDPPGSKVKETVRPPRKLNSEIPDQKGRPVPVQPQATLNKKVLPAINNKKAELPLNRIISPVLGQVNPENAPVQSGYESAKAEFDARRYEQAAAMFSSMISNKQSDAALYERSLRHLADCYYFLGEGGDRNFHAKAVDSYSNILRHYPDLRSGNDVVNYRLASCLERSGRHEEAYVAYERVITKYPGSIHEQDALYRMGEILYLTKRYRHAIDKLRQYVNKYPAGNFAAQAHFILGYCLRQTNQKNEGALCYHNALSKGKDHEELPGDILYDLGVCQLSLQEYSRAVDFFSLYLNLHPEGVLKKSALFHLGESLYFLNHFSSALRVFSLLLESYPETTEAYESILFMANIGVIDPKADFKVCMTGHDYFRNPVETYDGMREKFPGGRLEEWLLYQKGYALWKAGRYRDAFDLYCTLLDSFSHGILEKESRAYLVLNAKHLIEASYGKGDDLAIADLYYKIRNKIPVLPETTEMFFKIGGSLWRLGLMSETVAVWNRLRQNCQNPSQRALLDLIMIEADYSQGRAVITEEKWNSLLRALAENKSETASRARKNMADYFYRKGQYDKVIPLYETLLREQGNSALLPISKNYAHALRNQNLCSSAIERYLGIINRCKENPQTCDEGFLAEAYAGLGDCYFDNADHEQDIAMYQQALPGLKDKETRMWTLFRMGQSYGKRDDSATAGKIFSELKGKSGDPFWQKVVDYWVADQAWSRNNVEYSKRN